MSPRTSTLKRAGSAVSSRFTIAARRAGSATPASSARMSANTRPKRFALRRLYRRRLGNNASSASATRSAAALLRG